MTAIHWVAVFGIPLNSGHLRRALQNSWQGAINWYRQSSMYALQTTMSKFQLVLLSMPLRCLY